MRKFYSVCMAVLLLSLWAGCGEDVDDPVLDSSVNATLAGLSVSVSGMTPAFNPSMYSYSLTTDAAELTVTPSAGSSSAVVKVNGAVVQSGSGSVVQLVSGLNYIAVAVTDSSDQLTLNKSYLITVNRVASGPRLEIRYAGTALTNGATVDLGQVPAGSPQTVFIAFTNTGNSNLLFNAGTPRAVLSGASAFSVSQDLPASAAPLGGGLLQLQVLVPDGNSYQSVLYITNNGPVSPFAVNLKAEGLADTASLLTNLYITEWADVGSDVDYIELRNFGTQTLYLDTDFRINFGTATSASLVSWGIGNDTNQWQAVSAGDIAVAPGEIIIVADSDLFNATDGTANYDQFITWGMPAGTKVFTSTEATLLGSGDRLSDNQAWLSHNSRSWSYTPSAADFASIGTSTLSSLKVGFDPAVSSSSNASNWVNTTATGRSIGTWE